MKAYAQESKEILDRLQVDPNNGLNAQSIIENRKKYGCNKVSAVKKKTLADKLFENIKEPMVIILIIAAGITAGVNVIKYLNGYETEFIECIGIILAIALTITITLVMEGRSERAFELLSQMQENIQVKVIRDGTAQLIEQSELVVGDILLVATGDKMMVDGRLIEANELQVDESMLTGESQPISKGINPCALGTVVAERTNMLYSGSFIIGGSGKVIVTDVGSGTEFGKIAEGLSDHTSSQTPLQEKLKKLGQIIALAGASIAILTFILQLIAMGGAYTLENVSEAFISSIVLIVAAVPEGLSTIVAASLAINVIKLAKQNTLVKKMIACETIGSTNIICSDKTGTLTENKMTVMAIEISSESNNEPESYLLKNICVNSTADLELRDNCQVRFIGNPTEGALLIAAYKRGIDYKDIRAESKKVYMQPFSSENKKMTTVIKEQGYLFLTKGSPEKILSLCQLGPEEKESIELKMKSYQTKACRLIAFCHKGVSIKDNSNQESIEQGKEIDIDAYEKEMIYDGFAAIADPLRKESFDAVAKCKDAHIEVKMMTGDNRITAEAIANELQIIEKSDLIVEAKELEELDDDKFKEILPHIRVIARSTPLIKMRVVNTLKEMGNVVAVTGDGINDAPALKHADIGIAMGISGTEVSKEASDMILLDDSFSTIIKAVEWGRGLYDNFQRFIQFQLTVNVASVLVVLGSLLLGFGTPFTPLQLLWINVIMDGPPALTLGLEPICKDLMKRKPVSRVESIVSKSMFKSIIRNGIVISLLCLLQNTFNFLDGLESEQSTILFTLFMVCQLFNAFNSRKLGNESLVKYGFNNKKLIIVLILTFFLQIGITQFGGSLFNTVPLNFMMWVKIVTVGASLIVWDEAVRWGQRKLELKIKNK